MNLQGELAVAIEVAREAGALLRRRQREPFVVREKPGGEVVTDADIEANALIRGRLLASYPHDAVYSEETADTTERLQHGRVWIVDPLDATSSFVQGGDEFSVSIGLAVAGRAVLGVVFAPRRDDLVAGGASLGVTHDGARTAVLDGDDLQGARIAVSKKELARGLAGAPGLPDLRPLASMAHKLARVAAGLEDAAFSLKRRKEWGTCAGTALVLEAGGVVTDLTGAPLTFNRPLGPPPLGLVAAGRRRHTLLLAAASALIGEPELAGGRP